MRHFVLVAVLLATGLTPAAAQTDTTSTQAQAAGAPVVFKGDTLVWVQARLGPFGPVDRARAVVDRLTRVSGDPLHAKDSVVVAEGEGSSDILIGDQTITSVTDADAAAAGVPRATLASERAQVIQKAMRGQSIWAIVKALLLGALFTLLATAVLVVAIKLSNRFFPALYARLESWRGSKIPTLRIQRLELLSATRMTDGLIAIAKVLRIGVLVILLFYYVPLVFSFFPWTQNFASTLFSYVAAPVKQAWTALISYIPNLFYMAVIVAVTYYVLKFIRLFFDGIAKGALQFRGFHDEWADPTYKIVRFLVMAFALVVIFPYLPGSGSDAFKGVSVFFGVLLSFGSAGAIGNVIAGVVITYMRPFKLGDRVKIADTTGDVIERTLLVTRVRTIKNVDITIPNAMVLASHIINYSSTARAGGVILHTGVTIGFDAPWKQVHQLLIDAAGRTDNLMKEPQPFVLQTSLDDFYVSYELNVYTEKPHIMAQIYSDLHQNIQDVFNEAGVEITSPHYGAMRDGNRIAIPESYIPKSYEAPAFRLFPLGGSKPTAGPPPAGQP
jgi:small-conductance mechanosensitive channel